MHILPKRAQQLLQSIPFIILGLVLFFGAADSLSTHTASGQEPTPGDPSRGGRLYIAWDLFNPAGPPDEINPLWPVSTTNTVPRRVTWRCVNCHSWDYRGSNSQTQSFLFRNLSFPSLFGMVEQPPEVILPWLNGENNPKHDFSEFLTERDMDDLTAFLSSGLVIPEMIADVETNQVRGTLDVGETNFVEFCASCHGVEGEKLNLGTIPNPIYLGDMAWTNPWRVAHIIRFGHLVTHVPAAEELGISFSQQIDIVAYAQTLPDAFTISDPAFLEVDFDSQASTEPLAYGAILLGLLVFSAAWISVRIRNR